MLFYCMVPLVKLNNRKKGTLIIKGSLRNLVVLWYVRAGSRRLPAVAVRHQIARSWECECHTKGCSMLWTSSRFQEL